MRVIVIRDKEDPLHGRFLMTRIKNPSSISENGENERQLLTLREERDYKS
jgi:hypothetical protein